MSDYGPYAGPWLVRLATGQPVSRAIDPILARDLNELEQTLSGMLAAVTLLGPGEHCQIGIDATT